MPRDNIAQVYADVNTSKPREYSDYSNHVIRFGRLDDYERGNSLGGGKFSKIFEAIRLRDGEKVVLKEVLYKRMRLNREVKVLETLRGGPNIIRLLDTVLDVPSRTRALVFERVASTDFRDVSLQLTDLDLRHYTRQLLLALDYCHSKGIMHRDVKPGNVMVDHEAGKLWLIDMGHAEFYFPGKEYKFKVGTPKYQAPELLLKHGLYDYSLDMWSVGCMLACVLFGRDPFFPGENKDDTLATMAKMVGSAPLQRYVMDYSIDVDLENKGLLGHPGKVWHGFQDPDNRRLVNAQALDFLDRLLVFDHRERLTACQALNHPYLSTSTHPAPTSTSTHPAPTSTSSHLAPTSTSTTSS